MTVPGLQPFQQRASDDTFRTWMNILAFVRKTDRNADLLTKYFFRSFLGTPELFYSFLLYLGKELRGDGCEHASAIASQYLAVLSPLAERFGIFDQKDALDSVCLEIINPEAFALVQTVMEQYQKKSKSVLQKIRERLQATLKTEGHRADVKGRYKSIYSAYRKLVKKHRESPLTLHDIFAFRIILEDNNREKCFEVLNLLHDRFLPIAHRFKDYINIPKVNGYQSIHTCLNHVVADLDLPIEVQIRTRVMDDFVERGIASHWLYAQDKRSRLLTRTETRLLKHFEILSASAECNTDIYVFSIGGDIFMLPQGSTALDFAYMVHTDVGNKAKASFVNGKRGQIGIPLKDGDRVEIVKDSNDRVSRDWLGYAHNPSTHKKIREYARR